MWNATEGIHTCSVSVDRQRRLSRQYIREIFETSRSEATDSDVLYDRNVSVSFALWWYSTWTLTGFSAQDKIKNSWKQLLLIGQILSMSQIRKRVTSSILLKPQPPNAMIPWCWSSASQIPAPWRRRYKLVHLKLVWKYWLDTHGRTHTHFFVLVDVYQSFKK